MRNNPPSNSITEKLITSHNNARKHLQLLLDGVDERSWNFLPQKSAWSLQSMGVEILNYEITLLRNYQKDRELLRDDIPLSEFKKQLNEISQLLINTLREESEKHGFVWNSDKEGTSSIHWIIVRTIQHSVYHNGGISVLRHLVGLPRANYEHWQPMVDSVFLSGLDND
ncbi:MAG: hypothetical protein ACXADH_00765 [Candidatus Kariarchaeaceae archaeon]|jgi:hypothetical protein